MNKQQQRRIKSTKFTFQNQKQNTSGQDIQSLLVSSIRYDNQIPINQSQGHQFKSKPSQSLIKKQYFSNVYIEESSQSKCQMCQKKIEAINQNVGMINIKLKQLQSKLNICLGKYGKMQTKIGEFDIFIEQVKMFQTDNQQKIRQMMESIVKNEEENRFRLKQRTQELNRMKKSLSRLQNRQIDKMCHESKLVEHKFQKFKDQHETKMKQVIQTLEKMNNLQRKMLDSTQKSEQNTLFLQQPIKKKYFRTYSICQKNRTNQSTNISYSRNYQFPK